MLARQSYSIRQPMLASSILGHTKCAIAALRTIEARPFSVNYRPAPDLYMVGRILPHCFVHDVQRVLSVGCAPITETPSLERSSISNSLITFETRTSASHKLLACIARRPALSLKAFVRLDWPREPERRQGRSAAALAMASAARTG